VKPLTPEEAFKENMAIPVVATRLEPAKPFLLPINSAFAPSRLKAVECLTAAIYYEAASESVEGQRGVAQVVLNRVRHPAYPKSVCGVVYQGSERSTGCQFSFTCDGSLARQPSRTGWQLARNIAVAALSGVVEPRVGTATHYHTVWVAPYWSPSLAKIAVIGAHIFYRFPGYWGKRSAFTGAYAGETVQTADPLAAAEELLGDAASALAADAPPLDPAKETGLMIPQGQLIAPVATPALRVDEAKGALIADENAAGQLGADAATTAP
jgi:hypothetical protein